MKHNRCIIIIILSLCLTIHIASDSHALSFTNVGKAEDKITEALNLRKNGLNDEASQRISDAVGLLNDTLAKEPDNHQAQYLLGQCYWMQGNEGKAIDLFRRASEASDYRPKVVAFIKDEADLANSRGDHKRVFRLYDYTVQIDPSEKAGIVDKLETDADSILKAGNFELSQVYYQTVIHFEPASNVQAADAFFEAGEKNSDPRTKLHLYRISLEFDAGKRQSVIDAGTTVFKDVDRKIIEPEMKKFPDDVEKAIVTAVWPDWPWKAVYQKTFTGVGYTGGDIPEDNDGSIETARAGTDYQIGYRYTVIDSDFEVWREGGWKKFRQGQWLTVDTITPGNYETFRNEVGKKFTVVFQKR